MKRNIDPRTSIILIALISTLSVLAGNIYALLMTLSIAVLSDILLGVRLYEAFRRIKGFFTVLVFIAVAQSISMPGGQTIVGLFGVRILTDRGLNSALSFLLRMSILISAVLLGTTHDSRRMTEGLVKMKIPYELAFMTGIALKFLPVFRQEFSDRLNAVALRGINIKRLWLPRKLRVYAYIIVPAVSGSMIKSRDIASSMETRAFRAYPCRTALNDLRLRAIDYIIIGLAVSVFFFMIYSMYIGRFL